jgi:hypothetical protein
MFSKEPSLTVGLVPQMISSEGAAQICRSFGASVLIANLGAINTRLLT